LAALRIASVPPDKASITGQLSAMASTAADRWSTLNSSMGD